MITKFETHSAHLARFRVESHGNGLSVLRDNRMQIYSLGFSTRPLFRLTQPFSPDDAWAIDVLHGGEHVADGSPPSEDTPLRLCRQWLSNAGVMRGLQIPGLLPDGEYYIVRNHRPLRRSKYVLLGNEYVKTPENALTISEEKPIFAYAWSDAAIEHPQAPDHPLVGMTVLNCTGDSDTHNAFFFSFMSAWSTRRSNAPTDGCVLILPIESSLVVDNLEAFTKNSRSSYAVWKESLLPQFVSWSTLNRGAT